MSLMPPRGRLRRVVILGRGGAGKSSVARRLGEVTGLPVTELDAVCWQPELSMPEPAHWAGIQQRLVSGERWILEGDLGPYDSGLGLRLAAADTVIVLDFGVLRCAWRTLRRGRERADYWRWMLGYRRRSLPGVIRAIAEHAPKASVHVIRRPRQIRRLLASAAEAGRAGL